MSKSLSSWLGLTVLTVLTAIVAGHWSVAEDPGVIRMAQDYFMKTTGARGEVKRRADGALVISSGSEEICLPDNSCAYYRCQENKWRCGPSGYFTELGDKYCGIFERASSNGTFDEHGVRWLNSVKICLQRELMVECDLHGDCGRRGEPKTCDQIRSFALRSHPDCYVDSDFCGLGRWNYLGVMRTLGLSPLDEWTTPWYGAKAVGKCLDMWGSRADLDVLCSQDGHKRLWDLTNPKERTRMFFRCADFFDRKQRHHRPDRSARESAAPVPGTGKVERSQ